MSRFAVPLPTLPRAWRPLLASPWFWAILLLKLVVGSLIASHYPRDLFIPFVNHFVESGLTDPWRHFAGLGRWNAFPYPPLMLLILAVPRWLFSPLLAPGVDTVTFGHLLVLRLPMLAADLGIMVVLLQWFPQRERRVLAYYWCSPLVFYVCYWHGQLDILPTALFLVSLQLLRSQRNVLGLVVLGLGLATKLHLAVALPFVLVYLRQRRSPAYVARMAAVPLLMYAAIVLPFATPAFARMVYGTAEQQRLFAFQLPVGVQGLAVLLAPLAVIVLWLRFAAYRLRNWDLFILYLGLLFGVFVVLAPPAPGYFLWSLPFVVYFLCRSPRAPLAPYILFTVSYFAFQALSPDAEFLGALRLLDPRFAGLRPSDILARAASPAQIALWHNLTWTAMQASLAGLMLDMYLIGVRSNAVYQMRPGPIVVGIAGDSGSGKDTLSDLLTCALGERHVTTVSGDDYHRWPRGHENWQIYSHLDARANDLHGQQAHAVALADGRSIFAGTYDHLTGTFREKRLIDPGDVVIFQGLHGLALAGLRDVCALKIFLDPDEALRRLWKARRDVQQRGHALETVLASLERRAQDREKYVLPQRALADLTIRWHPSVPLTNLDLAARPELTLELLASNTFDWTRLAALLQGVPTLAADHEPLLDPHLQRLRISGHVTAEALMALCEEILPDIMEIPLPVVLAPDMEGCLQLAVLTCLGQRLATPAIASHAEAR